MPVVAAVHGYCIGSGIEIALLCDIRIGAESAVFAMPEVQLGMIPAAGGTQTVPRIAGWSSAWTCCSPAVGLEQRKPCPLGLLHESVAQRGAAGPGLGTVTRPAGRFRPPAGRRGQAGPAKGGRPAALRGAADRIRAGRPGALRHNADYRISYHSRRHRARPHRRSI